LQPTRFLPTAQIHRSPLPRRRCLQKSTFPQDLAAVMRQVQLLLALLFACHITGCDSLQKKHDNPVMTAAPQRVQRIEPNDDDTMLAENDGPADDAREVDGSDIVQIKRELDKKNPWDDWKDDTAIFNSQVAATVNGVPILNGDVLDSFTVLLQGERERMRKWHTDPSVRHPGEQPPTPETYERLRYLIISRNINQFIQNKLLVEYLKAGLKPDQIKLMDGHVDEQFAFEIEKLKRDLKVTNKTELELALNKKGTTLQNVKDNFALQRLAQECIGIKSEKPKPIERPDLVKYYQDHPDLYVTPDQVKWQQIQVSFQSPTATQADKQAAHKKIEEAIAELKKGTRFESVARKYSDGPTAKDGGTWDWLEKGSLADTKLEKKLFSMPVGKLSEIHEGPTSYSVVRVTERKHAGRKPFLEVQDDVRATMEKEQNQRRYVKFMKNLYARAVIESSYDIQTFPDI
jgi:parvulin-like peptidyl-prolyl isomerase